VKFDQLTKNKLRNFDQTPKLTETFDQLIWSSEIRSSDCFPLFFPNLEITNNFVY
jgi:hypothetical protein